MLFCFSVFLECFDINAIAYRLICCLFCSGCVCLCIRTEHWKSVHQRHANKQPNRMSIDKCAWTNVVRMCVKNDNDENRCDSHAMGWGNLTDNSYTLSTKYISTEFFLLISTYTFLSLLDGNTFEVFTLNLISQYEYIHSYTASR